MSSDDSFISGVAYPQPFAELAIELAESASRYLHILSPALDHDAFGSNALESAISGLARSSQQTQVRILIKDSRAMVSRGHPLLVLARRMPSSVSIRKLTDHPDWHGQTLVIRDRDGVLFKPGEANKDGFYEPDSRASTERHYELFQELWRFSEDDPNLRTLSL
ncbi:hypothetical protein BST95_12200 [Halioglobus japonicus]|uniref:DUF7931 domain-containing protein n=1 Tax=Halioglobus japonicus TaxID=930805 RepID=A0AAP8SNX2_9GAMM|nr:hypothetical protein [Halioglobus japonicus]AQA18886.1 hypothetical protein BST95_12200 [Halioglobus japonicus]PLW86926.1 hypothetical protein C0029_11205 [Halioglobus japonicus]GHD23364.1 hypothetical protein GCM10007052_35920 [Halioglobus japonicus]